MIKITKSGCIVSDLEINYTNKADGGFIYAISAGAGGLTDLQNLDISASFSSNNTAERAAIYAESGNAIINVLGKVNIETSGYTGYGIFAHVNSTCNISENSKINIITNAINGSAFLIRGNLDISSGTKINIQTTGTTGYGIATSGTNATTNINSGAQIKIQTTGTTGHGIYASNNATINIRSGAELDISTSGMSAGGMVANRASLNLNKGADAKVKTYGTGASALRIENGAITTIAGNLIIETKNYHGIFVFVGSNNLNILSSATIYADVKYNAINRQATTTSILDIAQGAKIAIAKDGATKWYEMQDKFHNESDWTNVNVDNIETVLDVSETKAWSLPSEIEIEEDNDDSGNDQNIESYQTQFNTALKEYDKLINDCGYQGINLLKGGNLKLTFDENREHIFNILGQDISSVQLGINEALWQTQVDINNSIDEIKTAITTLRSLAEELGNQYSVIQTRINFTEGLSDILQTGADDLTLADMNEASAQYLSLQTRQQLAINSLSLAAQSASSVLSLF